MTHGWNVGAGGVASARFQKWFTRILKQQKVRRAEVHPFLGLERSDGGSSGAVPDTQAAAVRERADGLDVVGGLAERHVQVSVARGVDGCLPTGEFEGVDACTVHANLFQRLLVARDEALRLASVHNTSTHPVPGEQQAPVHPHSKVSRPLHPACRDFTHSPEQEAALHRLMLATVEDEGRTEDTHQLASTGGGGSIRERQTGNKGVGGRVEACGRGFGFGLFFEPFSCEGLLVNIHGVPLHSIIIEHNVGGELGRIDCTESRITTGAGHDALGVVDGERFQEHFDCFLFCQVVIESGLAHNHSAWLESLDQAKPDVFTGHVGWDGGVGHTHRVLVLRYHVASTVDVAPRGHGSAAQEAHVLVAVEAGGLLLGHAGEGGVGCASCD